MPRCGAASASNCQTSSVTNGIIGCSSRKSVSSVWASTRWAVGRAAGSLRRALTIST